MARTLTVDLGSEAFVSVIPQPPTRRNWRAMILESDESATRELRDKLLGLGIQSLSMEINSPDPDLFRLGADSLGTAIHCGQLSSSLTYHDSAVENRDKIISVTVGYYGREKVYSFSNLNTENSIHDWVSGLKKPEAGRALLIFCILGALSYFDSSRPLAVTPFGYLSPQMLYVVCKLLGLKVRSLE